MSTMLKAAMDACRRIGMRASCEQVGRAAGCASTPLAVLLVCNPLTSGAESAPELVPPAFWFTSRVVLPAATRSR
eukprot:347758-Chlamydomonas_euryale.AAC.4